MSKDTDFKLTFTAPSREQLQHILAFLDFKKQRWDSWKERGLDSETLAGRSGASSTAGVVSWGFDLCGEINVQSSGTASVKATAWANENYGNVWISGDEGELADLRKRFEFLKITGTYKTEYGDSGEV